MTLSQKPLVSIVIPCYNSAPFVRAAIDSALDQTHAHMEIIVVDDGSTDDTSYVLSSYGNRIRAVTQPNRGPSAARNVGLRMARGEFVQFLDADDVLLPEKIEVCLNAMPSGLGIPFVLKEFVAVPGAPSAHPTTYVRLSVDSHGDWNPQSPVGVLTTRIGTPAPLHRTSLIQQVGGWNENLRNREDVELHFRLALAGARFHQVDRVLVRCREHQGVDRLRTAPDAAAQAILGEMAIYEIASREGVLDGQLKDVIADRLAMAGRRAYERGHTAEARKLFTIARTLNRSPRLSRSQGFNLLARLVGLERASGISGWIRGVGNRNP